MLRHHRAMSESSANDHNAGTGHRQRPRRILVTGLPGVGKTTLCGLCRAAGLNAIDLDDTHVLSWGRRPARFLHRSAASWLFRHGARWDIEQLVAALEDDAGDIYVFGIARNGTRALKHFDKVIYLHIDRETLSHRKRKQAEVKLLVRLQRPIDALAQFLAKVSRKIDCINAATSSPDDLYRELLERLRNDTL